MLQDASAVGRRPNRAGQNRSTERSGGPERPNQMGEMELGV